MALRRMGQAHWTAMYMLTVFNSNAYVINLLMVLHIIWDGAFIVWLGVLFGYFPNMNQAAAWLRDLGRTR